MSASGMLTTNRVLTPESFVDVKSSFSHKNHIVPGSRYQKQHAALCGNVDWASRNPTADALKSEFILHPGDEVNSDVFCAVCFLVFSGVLPSENPAVVEQLNQYYPNNHNYWCELCSQTTSHRTDRHAHFLGMMRTHPKTSALSA